MLAAMNDKHPDDAAERLALLNIYEVEGEEPGRTRHLVGFMDPVLAGAIGLSSHAMVGEFEPGADGQFDPDTFQVNPEFVEALIRFLNEQPARSPQLAEGAREIPGKKLYIVDPRATVDDDADPEPEDVLGWFTVSNAGTLEPDSFEYNAEHRWFSKTSGVSGLLMDRSFYAFLHPQARSGG